MEHETKQSSQRGKHEWLRNISIMFNNAPSKHHRLTNKRHNVGNGLLLLALLANEDSQKPKHYKILPIFLIILQNLMVRTLLRKTLHSWIVEHEEIKVVFIGKPYPYWLVFMVLERIVHDIRGKKTIIILTQLWTTIANVLVRHATGTIVVRISWEYPVTFWWNLRPTLKVETHK